MNRLFRSIARLGALIAVLLIIAGPLHMARADSPPAPGTGHAPGHIKVEVTDLGFNGKTDGLVIEVEQGQMVELTFTWAHQSYPREEHIMVLQGYGLETDRLNSSNREATLKFIADKAGTFNFKCDVECDVHDYLQQGYLKVKRSGSAAADGSAKATFTPTTLALSPSAWVTGGEAVTLTAVLRDPGGVSVPKAELSFYLEAEFGGSKGKMWFAKARTDANGVAFLEYRPILEAPKQTITARFDGMGIYAESEQAIEVQVIGVPPSAYDMEPTGLTGPSLGVWLGGTPPQPALSAWSWAISNWGPLALATMVLAMWGVFGFILYQAFRISRVRPRR
ncbi:MAG: hypothetical protein HYU29_01460 [Chloroflexi bacterium]|nr:hypothetical protein [Chloroflexota bacterium]